MKPYGRNQSAKPPDGTLRRSQAVGTFGPGAMMDLVQHAVLVGGLDFWGPDARYLTGIPEPRLRDRLATRLKGQYTLSVEKPFCSPPEGDDRNPTVAAGIQALEFPTWFVCQGCRTLGRGRSMPPKGGRHQHQCSRTKSSECVPVRFLAACRRGHCEDWPWVSFVHLKSGACGGGPDALRLEEGASGDFQEIRVSCTVCNASQPMSAAYVPGVFGCSGERPWLGSEGRQACKEKVRLLVRTASNSYFPLVVSALSIPEDAHALAEAVDSVWDVLQAADSAVILSAFAGIPKIKEAIGGYAATDVLAAIAARKADQGIQREPLRTAEYRVWTAAEDEKPGDVPADTDQFFARRVHADVPEQVSRLVLASTLREVRVQTGFTRLDSMSPDLQGEFDLEVRAAMLGLQTDWLPATEVIGEGVFLELDPEQIEAWENRPEVKKRERLLKAAYEEQKQTGSPDFPGVRFYMLHSLSHLLMLAISLECGYAASAIRERIYCAPADDALLAMSGILISTGTSGTEGTLGGLIEQGRSLREHLRRAWDLGELCSNDPVCGGHDPVRDHTDRKLEGAACHGCLFVAECSCERFNRYLDRALVVPTIGLPAELAFFGTRP